MSVRVARLCLNHLKRRLSGTNLSLENNLPIFWLNAPLIIRAKVAFSWNIGKLFSFIYAEANWEATENNHYVLYDFLYALTHHTTGYTHMTVIRVWFWSPEEGVQRCSGEGCSNAKVVHTQIDLPGCAVLHQCLPCHPYQREWSWEKINLV